MDAFSAQIVKFVRAMPDDALLELVKQKLGVLGVAAARSNGRKAPVLPTPARGSASPGGGAGANANASNSATGGTRRASSRGAQRPASRRRPVTAARRPVVSAERQGMLDNVERIVKAGPGMSASDVAKSASIPQTRAAAALKELKLAKRIFQGGDRRFARYAGDAKTAEQASQVARKNAKGPAVPAHKANGQRRKRSSAQAVAPAA